MFVFFLSLSLSTLKQGDDPYEILGISHSATEKEIKDAFRQKTRKYHPDINKAPDAEKIWIHCNDAYELLKDPDRKAAYDRTGSVSEEPIGQPYYSNAGYGDPMDDIFSAFFGGHSRNFDVHSEEIDKQKLFKILHDERDCVLLVSNGGSTSAFENVCDSFSNYIHMFRCRDPTIRRQLCGNKNSVYAYICLKPDGTIHSVVASTNMGEEELRNWIIDNWGPKVTTFSSLNTLTAAIKLTGKFIRIVELAADESASVDTSRAASKYGDYAQFSLLNGDFVNVIRKYKLKKLPTTLVFINGKFVSEESSVQSATEKYLFAKIIDLKQGNVGSFFVVYSGKPSLELVNKVDSFTEAPIAYTKSSSGFARKLGMKEGQFCFVSLKKGKYFVVEDGNLARGYMKFKKAATLSKAKRIPQNFGITYNAKNTFDIKRTGQMAEMLNSILATVSQFLPILFFLFFGVCRNCIAFI